MIIGFLGDCGVGKTTSAQYLSVHYGYVIKSFAKPIKDISKTLFDMNDIDFSVINKERPFKAYEWTPRDILVRLGQFIRFHDEDYFVRKMILYPGLSAVIDDVRYENEAKLIQSKGGILIRIRRYPSMNPYGKKQNKDIVGKSSETLKTDFTIEEPNNISLISLYNEINKVMQTLGEVKLK